jgi:hypothetical protein
MGYACYDTPRGMAGYAVADTCNRDGCDEEISRGLDALCGGQPGYAADGGCGRWFCGEHTYGTANPGVQFCPGCKERWEREHPGKDFYGDEEIET